MREFMKHYTLAWVIAVILASSGLALSGYGNTMEDKELLSGLRNIFLGELGPQSYPELSFVEPLIPKVRSLLKDKNFSEIRAKLASEQVHSRLADDWQYWALSAYISAELNDREAARRQTRRISEMPGIESRQALESWKTFRALGGVIPPDRANEVFGVIVETNHAGHASLVAAYSDQSTRFLTDAGEAVLGEKEDFPQASRDMANRMIRLAKQLPQKNALANAPEPPVPEEVHVVVLTSGGFRLHREIISSATDQANTIAPIFNKAGELLSILKDFRREVAAKPGYTVPGGPAPNITAVKSIRTLPGSPAPKDPYEPHMPVVGISSNMDELFTTARRRAQGGFVIVTPERQLLYISTVHIPFLGDKMGKLFPAGRPWKITIISYTKLPHLEDSDSKPDAHGIDLEEIDKCIPFTGYLSAWADAEHNIVVFEGHPSALEAGVRGSDVLIVDSGMLPHLRKDWFSVAHEVLAQEARIYIHSREYYALLPVIASSESSTGWETTEPDDEGSYSNLLLSALALGPTPKVVLKEGRDLPDLGVLTNQAEQLDWIWKTPFRYNDLDAEMVMEVIISNSRKSFFSKTRTIEAVVGENDKPPFKTVEATFKIVEKLDHSGTRELEIRVEK